MRRKTLVESKNAPWALGALTIVTAFAFGLIITDNVTSENTPLITIVTGFFGLFITSALGKAAINNSVDRVEGKVDQVLNGEMENKMRAVVREVLAEHQENQT